MDRSTNTPKIYPVDQVNCVHKLEYAYTAEYYYRPISIPIYRCIKCGYEQVGNDHIEGNKYE